MQKVIHKFPLLIMRSQTVMLHREDFVLCVKVQNHRIVLYAEVSATRGSHDHVRKIYMFGTGHPFPETGMDDTRYIGTAMMPDGLVWHVYEDIWPSPS